jgi:hypothetical protein
MQTGYDSIDFLIKVVNDPGNALAQFPIPPDIIGADAYLGYFWANQFAFVGGNSNGVDGYMGIQTVGEVRTFDPGARNNSNRNLYLGHSRIAIFSIWQSTDARSGPINSYCAPFGHEGSGWSCKVKYPWQAGVEYRLRISKTPATVTAIEADWWRGVIIDSSTAQETIIGDIRVPSTWSGLKKDASCFTEYYSSVVNQRIGDEDDGKPNPRVCQYIPKAEVVIYPPMANGSVIVSEMKPNNYGKCANVSSFAVLRTNANVPQGTRLNQAQALVNRTGSIERKSGS